MEVRSNKLGDIRSHYRRKLAEVYSEQEADILLFNLMVEFTGYTRAEILANRENTISESELLKIHFGAKELMNHKPLQYIIEKAEFYGLNFKVNSKVLIPRPETEELVDRIIKTGIPFEKAKIIDIGTGSGCIAITLKKYFPKAEIIAVDISEFALGVASYNANRNNVSIDFRKLDFLYELARKKLGSFDLIVSNPPYVRPSEKELMKKNVIDYEPPVALYVDEQDPLTFYRAIATFCKYHLNKNGNFFCEINQYLGHEIVKIFVSEGFLDTEISEDMFGNTRFISGTKK